MSKIGVKLTINCSKIEKERLFVGKNGKYLDCTVFIDLDEKDQFDNNGMITQDVTKAERDMKVKGPILGNCKVFYDDRQKAYDAGWGEPQAKPESCASGFDDFDDDITF